MCLCFVHETTDKTKALLRDLPWMMPCIFWIESKKCFGTKRRSMTCWFGSWKITRKKGRFSLCMWWFWKVKSSLIFISLASFRITPAVVAARMKELLRGHHSLILRFNKFLPKEHEIKLKHEPRPELVRLVDNIKVNYQIIICCCLFMFSRISLSMSVSVSRFYSIRIVSYPYRICVSYIIYHMNG